MKTIRQLKSRLRNFATNKIDPEDYEIIMDRLYGRLHTARRRGEREVLKEIKDMINIVENIYESSPQNVIDKLKSKYKKDYGEDFELPSIDKSETGRIMFDRLATFDADEYSKSDFKKMLNKLAKEQSIAMDSGNKQKYQELKDKQMIINCYLTGTQYEVPKLKEKFKSTYGKMFRFPRI